MNLLFHCFKIPKQKMATMLLVSSSFWWRKVVMYLPPFSVVKNCNALTPFLSVQVVKKRVYLNRLGQWIQKPFKSINKQATKGLWWPNLFHSAIFLYDEHKRKKACSRDGTMTKTAWKATFVGTDSRYRFQS